MAATAEQARTYMAQLGFRSVADMVGHAEMLEQDEELLAGQDGFLGGIDLSAMLVPAHELRNDVPTSFCEKQDHGLSRTLDARLVEECASVLGADADTDGR
jgi:glutamate synthase (NADPH/NADH)